MVLIGNDNKRNTSIFIFLIRKMEKGGRREERIMVNKEKLREKMILLNPLENHNEEIYSSIIYLM